MTTVAVFHKTTGEILWTVDVPLADASLQTDPEDSANTGAFTGDVDRDTHYIDDPNIFWEALDRIEDSFPADKTAIVNDGVDAVTITCPDPCYVSIDGAWQEVTGGTFTFTSTDAGRHTIRLVGKYKGPEVVVMVYDPAVLKARLKANIDASAEKERLKYVTPGSAQSMVYNAKNAEANAYLAVVDAGGTPTPEDYPIINAEAIATGATIADTVTLVKTTALAWYSVAAQIEAQRMAAKQAVEAAATVQDAITAAEVTWIIS